MVYARGFHRLGVPFLVVLLSLVFRGLHWRPLAMEAALGELGKYHRGVP